MKKAAAKLRILLIVLSMMAVLSSALGGYLYYSALKRALLESVHREAEEKLKTVGNGIDSYLKWSLFSVKSLAGLMELRQSLFGENIIALEDTHAILDHFRDDLNVSVSYIMDSSGKTIASSNREALDSFVGKNYGFRPYFKQAMQGMPAVYMALGVTSQKRGIYYSCPVYGKDKEKPLGVAVIKSSIEMVEKDFMKYKAGVLLLQDPHGFVFASNRGDWLYKVLWKPSLETISKITRTRQFGPGPWNWTGMKQVEESSAVDNLGNEYHLHQQELVNYPGWSLVFLHEDYDYKIIGKIIAPLRKTVGIGVLVSCLLFGLIVFFIFIKANTAIIQRKKAEKELKLSMSRLKATLESTTDGILVVDMNGKATASNELYAKMWKIPDHVLESNDDDKALAHVLDQLKDPNAFIKEVRALYADPDEKTFDNLYFKDGRIFERHSRPQKLDGETIGRVWSFRDVTKRELAQKEREKLISDIQNALAEVKTLSGLMPICSHCKKIRDDKGYWNQIEGYIQKHSDAKFSHGMCPECSDKLYGREDWYIEMKNEDS